MIDLFYNFVLALTFYVWLVLESVHCMNNKLWSLLLLGASYRPIHVSILGDTVHLKFGQTLKKNVMTLTIARIVRAGGK